MRRAALFLLAPIAAAGTDIRIPEASAAGKPVKGQAVVGLSGDGRILVETDGKEDSPSLDRLCAWLRERAAKFDEERKANGGGFSRLPGGIQASEMPVLLRVDANAPWLHVQRLLAACAEERIYRIGFGVKGAGGEEGRLPADLPVEREIRVPKNPAAAVNIRVRIEAAREETAVWGPTQVPVTKPAEIAFRLGETTETDIDKVRRYIRDAYQTAAALNPPSIRSEIMAGPKIPFGVVVSVLNEYHRAGLTNVDFYGAPPATADERSASRLPYPK